MIHPKALMRGPFAGRCMFPVPLAGGRGGRKIRDGTARPTPSPGRFARAGQAGGTDCLIGCCARACGASFPGPPPKTRRDSPGREGAARLFRAM